MAIEDIFSNQDMNQDPITGVGGQAAGKLIDKGADFFSNAFDKFKARRDSRTKETPKNYSDEVNQMLNIDNFSPDENDRSALANIQRISLNEPTIDVTQADVDRGGGLGQAGQVSVAGIGAMPIYVAKGSTLPLSLMEKRKEALRKVAEKKNTALKDFLEMPDNADPMYDRQLTDVMVNIADETASYQGIDMTDLSDPRVQDLMKKKARAESLYRVMDKTDGVIANARAIMEEVKKSGGEYIMDTKAYKDAQDLLLGRYSAEDLINDPDAYKNFLDVAGRIESESSAVHIFKTVVKKDIDDSIKTWIKNSRDEISSKLIKGVEVTTMKEKEEERINAYIDGVAEDQGWSDSRIKQIKKIAKNSFAKQYTKELEKIQKETAASIKNRKDEAEKYVQPEPQSHSSGEKYYTYNTSGKIEDKFIDSGYAMIRMGEGDNSKLIRIPSGLGFKGTTGNTTSYSDSQMISDFGQFVNGTELTGLMNELTESKLALEKAKDSGDEQAINNAQASYEDIKASYFSRANEVVKGFDARFRDRNFTKISLTEPYFANNDVAKKHSTLIQQLEDLKPLIDSADPEEAKAAAEQSKEITRKLQVIENSNEYFPAETVVEVPSSVLPNFDKYLIDLNERRGYESKEAFFKSIDSSLSKEQKANLEKYLHPDYLEEMGVKSKTSSNESKKTDKQTEQTEKKDVPSGQSKYANFKRKK